MSKYQYSPGGISIDSLIEFQEEAEKECPKPKRKKRKVSPEQREQGKKLAKEHGLQNQSPEKRKEIAKKGGEAKRKKTRSDAKCKG